MTHANNRLRCRFEVLSKLNIGTDFLVRSVRFSLARFLDLHSQSSFNPTCVPTKDFDMSRLMGSALQIEIDHRSFIRQTFASHCRVGVLLRAEN